VNANDMIILAIGLVVVFVIWKRMQTPVAPLVATTSNPLATAANLATGALSVGASVANAAIGGVGSVLKHLDPLSWGGDSARTKQRKEIQRQQTALKGAPVDHSGFNTDMVNMGRPDLQVDNSAYTSYIAANGIDKRAYYIA
jgi:hypothetical protein